VNITEEEIEESRFQILQSTATGTTTAPAGRETPPHKDRLEMVKKL
jgi:hypothetical protein